MGKEERSDSEGEILGASVGGDEEVLMKNWTILVRSRASSKWKRKIRSEARGGGGSQWFSTNGQVTRGEQVGRLASFVEGNGDDGDRTCSLIGARLRSAACKGGLILYFTLLVWTVHYRLIPSTSTTPRLVCGRVLVTKRADRMGHH